MASAGWGTLLERKMCQKRPLITRCTHFFSGYQSEMAQILRKPSAIMVSVNSYVSWHQLAGGPSWSEKCAITIPLVLAQWLSHFWFWCWAGPYCQETDAFYGAGYAASAAHLAGGHPPCPAETKRGCQPRTLGTRQHLTLILFVTPQPWYLRIY